MTHSASVGRPSRSTIADRMRETAGHATGFDYLRLVLALSVICFHVVLTCCGPAAQDALSAGPYRSLVFSILPMFFGLSGFLVAGSLDRNASLVTFAGLRLLRIGPALFVDTIFSALLLGPTLTLLPLHSYFSDHNFHVYFLNILGDIHFRLPGVFTTNPSDKVNGQLWTIPFELLCYLALGALALLGIYRRRVLLAALLAVFTVGMLAYYLLGHRAGYEHLGVLLVISFLTGVAFHLFREDIPLNGGLFLASLAAMQLLLLSPSFFLLASLPILYVTVFLGLRNPARIWPVTAGDYSYGLFLYGYPIQQTLVFLLPNLRVWYVQLPLAILATAVFAALSWHLFEVRALSHKKALYALESRWRRPLRAPRHHG